MIANYFNYVFDILQEEQPDDAMYRDYEVVFEGPRIISPQPMPNDFTPVGIFWRQHGTGLLFGFSLKKGFLDSLFLTFGCFDTTRIKAFIGYQLTVWIK